MITIKVSEGFASCAKFACLTGLVRQTIELGIEQGDSTEIRSLVNDYQSDAELEV